MKWIRAFGVLFLTIPAAAQYAGPAVLTRGESPSAMATPQISFQPFVGLNGVYDTGVAGVRVDSSGELASSAASGAEVTWGVSGTKTWKRTKLGLDYRGSVYQYSGNTGYDRTEQSLLLGFSRQMTRHTAINLRQSAGIFSRDFGLLGLPQTVPFDPAQSFVPTTDFFDNRTFYLSTQADYLIQKSTRLSFSMGGNAFLARRRSSALYGTTGAGARGDIQYRASRHSTIGVGYTYTHFGYKGVLSSTDIHGLVGSYAIQLTRTLEFTGFAGAMRAETMFLRNVQIDPAIAAIIGVPFGSIIVHRVDYVPNVSARLSRTFARGVLYASGGHTMTPGNGLFLTSKMTTAGAGYTYTGLRRWSFNTHADYHRATSIANIAGDYGGTSGGISASRKITRSIHVITNFNVRQYRSQDFDRYNRRIYTLRAGLGYTPGDIPLRIW